MRIIAGKHRGKKLAEFRGLAVRPTPDRVKESLFQVIEPFLQGARVLDLFAGSGALGIEALSRGASEAVFNDNSAESLLLVQKNLKATGEKGKLLRLGYEECLKSVSGKFDVIFADPPYREDLCGEILTLIASRGILEEGVVVYESEREEQAIQGRERTDLRRYGRTFVALFQRSGI